MSRVSPPSLSSLFSSNTSLKSLNLSDNHLPAQEMQHITDGFCAHPSLSRLTLAGETLDDTAARNVGRLAASDRLVSLDLSRTALAGSGAIAVIHALSSARGLKYLDLSDSSLGEGAATRELAIALQGTISVDRATERFPVRVLRLARCNLGPTGGALVARALGAKCSVEELDLSDNGLGAVAGKALAKSLRVQYLNGKQARTKDFSDMLGGVGVSVHYRFRLCASFGGTPTVESAATTRRSAGYFCV